MAKVVPSSLSRTLSISSLSIALSSLSPGFCHLLIQRVTRTSDSITDGEDGSLLSLSLALSQFPLSLYRTLFSISLSLSLFLLTSKPAGHNDSWSNQRWRRWLPPLSLALSRFPSLSLSLSLSLCPALSICPLSLSRTLAILPLSDRDYCLRFKEDEYLQEELVWSSSLRSETWEAMADAAVSYAIQKKRLRSVKKLGFEI